MKVLLVEDHQGLAEATRRVLSEIYQHEVEHAATGRDALDSASRFAPDLILIDLNLPDIDGFDLAARLRGETRFDQTILVALTGVGNAASERRVEESGFDAFYVKPMDFELLESLSRKR